MIVPDLYPETEIRGLREALRASEARFRSVVEGTTQGIIIQQDERIVYANPAMAALFGFDSPDDMIGLCPFEGLIVGEDLDVFRARTKAVLRGAALQPHPGWRARHRAGKTVWLSSTAHTSEWLGRPAVTSFYFDITERRAVEHALRESEARYRSALNAGRMGAWETDLIARTRRWTAEGMALFGISLPDGVGTVGGDGDEYASAIHPEDRHVVQNFYDQAETADSFLADYRIVRADGTTLWLSGRGQVVSRAPDGRAQRLVSIMADVTERKSSEQHIQLLMREITHRSKNLLAVVQSIARQTARTSGDIGEFEARLGSRLRGLAASHDVLVREDWRGAPLAELVRQQFLPFIEMPSSRIEATGPDVWVTADAAQSIGLALHELATNALKYGALSTAAGVISVRWSRVTAADGADVLRLEWQERGGPPVIRPTRTGFGHVMVKNLITASLGGDVELDYAADGLRWSVVMPAGNLVMP